ncbi:hypothetical protein [Mesorhizobium humile]|uniref:Uncharacterized protein n=1 Tax=Mesorhizobium humile TaxID=3072313 RepID=A0ABU4YDI7_9HYPH|nr:MULTISPECIES: hypothetical protein [unclassified Mesorhizobium]MDX8459201.1 hypothetical protein [Mesorhizobium sp. VK2D]MDX8484984.1 hypothetical protein [Mesorhizobium sp. VK2B]
MSPKTAQRFWENDTHQDKFLKRIASIRSCVMRFKAGKSATQ